MCASIKVFLLLNDLIREREGERESEREGERDPDRVS